MFIKLYLSLVFLSKISPEHLNLFFFFILVGLCFLQYPNEQALLSDFELMFNNARHYNEEGSQVYQDADMLDRILRAKWRGMSQSRSSSSKR